MSSWYGYIHTSKTISSGVKYFAVRSVNASSCDIKADSSMVAKCFVDPRDIGQRPLSQEVHHPPGDLLLGELALRAANRAKGGALIGIAASPNAPFHVQAPNEFVCKKENAEEFSFKRQAYCSTMNTACKKAMGKVG